jgi:magnesium transporter
MSRSGYDSDVIDLPVPEAGAVAAMAAALVRDHPTDAARILDATPTQLLPKLIDVLPLDGARHAVDLMSVDDVAHVISSLAPARGAEILQGMSPRRAAPVLRAMSAEAIDAVLDPLPADTAERYRRLADFAEESAGGIMDPQRRDAA